MLWFYLSISLVWLSLTKKVECGSIDNGVAYAESASDSSNGKTFCIAYNRKFKELPEQKELASSLPLINMTSPTYNSFCNHSGNALNLTGSVVAVLRGDCTFSEKASLAKSYGAVAILIISQHELHEPIAANESDYDSIKIIVALILSKDYQHIISMSKLSQNQSQTDVEMKFYAPPVKGISYNLILIWLLAVSNMAVGAYWSGSVQYTELVQRQGILPNSRRSANQAQDKNDFIMSLKYVTVAVMMMCAMLLCLYFFYDYMVYVIIGMFVVASSISLFDCLGSLIRLLPPFATCRLPEIKLPCCRCRPEVRDIILFIFCFGVGIAWFFSRHASYGWVLQDILGYAFCVEMMKKVRIHNLQVCCLLLIMLFVYDIFFVFITPLFTKNGESVMVDVATGGSSHTGEMLPMVFIIPRIGMSESAFACYRPYSLLGFGDVAVPGLLASFCHFFDLQVHSKRIYFLSNVAAYGISLILTFVALLVMEEGQPALLYIVPLTLGVTILISSMRKELCQIWKGKPKTSRADDSPDATQETSCINTETDGAITQRKSNYSSTQAIDDADDEYDLFSSPAEDEKMLTR